MEEIELDYEKEDKEIENQNIELKSVVEKYFSAVEHHYDGVYRAKEGIGSRYQFIKSIKLTNKGEETVPALMLRIKFNSEIIKDVNVSLPPLEIGEYNVDIPFFNVNYDLINKLTSALPMEVSIEVIDNHSEVTLQIDKHSFVLYPLSQTSSNFYEDLSLYAKLVIPSETFVKQITQKAVIYNNGSPIIGYQNDDNYDAILHELEALFVAIHKENIIYQNPPATDQIFQKIRLANEIQKDRKATCLDSSVLFCSCLVELGYEPLLIFVESHAFVGVFLRSNESNDLIINDAALQPLYSEGNEKIIFIETTNISADQNISFNESSRNALLTVKDNFGKYFVGVNVAKCHTGCYSPVSLTGDDEEICNKIHAKEISDHSVKKIDNKNLNDVTKEYEVDRFKIWERKLLDLKESNRLVNMRPTFTNSCKILINDISNLVNNSQLKINIIRFKKGVVNDVLFSSNELLQTELNINILDGEAGLMEVENNFNKLIKENKSSIEETGAPSLYISLGLIKFADPKVTTGKTKKPKSGFLYAPFMLLPVEVIKEPNGVEYFSCDIDNVRVNETVFEYIKLYLPNADFKSLYDFRDLSQYYDACQSFKNLCAQYRVSLQLEENIFLLSNLTFSHQVMYLDMHERQEELVENDIVSSIVNGSINFKEKLIADDENIEKLENYKDFVAPLAYDSSQLKAILDCGNGKSFILDGPPGTGKSQTIVNMITNAFYNKKTVLFVAEKKTALDVVYKRMADIQMDRFCLELHSDKANKTEFFKKIYNALDNGPSKNVLNYEDICDKLNEAKNDILNDINGMHIGKLYYYSLYDCIIKTKEYVKYSSNYIKFDEDFLKSLNYNNMNAIVGLIDNFNASIVDISNYDTSPLRYFGIQNINLFKDKENVLDELTNLTNDVKAFSKSIARFFNAFPIKLKINFENTIKLLNFYNSAYNKKLYLNDVVTLKNHLNDIEDELSKISTFVKYHKEFLKLYDLDKINTIDTKELLEELNNAKGLFKKSKINKVIEKIQPIVHYTVEPSIVGKFFIDIDEYNEEFKSIDELISYVKTISGLKLIDIIDDYDTVNATYIETLDMISFIENISENDSFELLKYFISLSSNNSSIEKLEYEYANNAFEKFKDDYVLLKNKYIINEYALNKADNYFAKLLEVLEYASLEENFEDLSTLSYINKLRNGFNNYKVLSLLDRVASGEIVADEMEELLEASISFGIMNLYCKNDKVSNFVGSELNKKITDYKALIDEYRGLSISKLSYDLSKDFISNNVTMGNSGLLGGLKKACKTGKGITIREVLSNYSEIIMHYLPCFLMSPLSAAQYLSASSNFPKFDIVIFDEASQIPVHEAIGPIARGKSLIIAGDPKQMPPSPYTRQEIEDASLNVIDKTKFSDSESLLDECLAIGLPRHRLTYHYRSKNESLIQFSNSNFYNNQLNTFPSSQISSTSVEFVHVKLDEPKVNSNITKEELDTICDKVKSLYLDDSTKNLTLGVISFNLGQADKIESAINNMLDNNLLVKENFDKASKKDEMFVKNIENVQGDERDIIIMCVGFGLNKSGTARLGGPLIAGDNNGERRLNVCASRAKEKMILISTLTSKQFKDDSKIVNNGERCLKKFIEYCEEMSTSKGSNHRVGTNNIIYYIQKDLKKLGYDSDTLVGSGKYAVDLAIKDKESNNYKLGIIIDTKPISDSVTCRDKYYLHESVLEMMKWHVIYIYALEYFLRPNQTINKIVEAINCTNAYNYKVDNIKINIENDTNNTAFEVLDFSIPNLPKISYNDEYGFDFDLIEACETLIYKLSPISIDLLKKIIEEKCLGEKMTKTMEKDFKKKVDMNLNSKALRDSNAGKDFFYISDERNMDKFYNSIERDIRDISMYEIMAAFDQINNMQPGLNQEDLFRISLKALNTTQKSMIKVVKDRLTFVYNEYINR